MQDLEQYIYDMAGQRSNASRIDVDKALQATLRRIDEEESRRSSIGGTRSTDGGKTIHLGVWLQRVAAVLFIPMLAVSVWLSLRDTGKVPQTAVVWTEMTAAPGLRSYICLPDSTHVWLNSGSKLSYPVSFAGNDRTVRLDGEAYFEVKADKAHPFTVTSNDVKVTATGTKFSVCDHADDNEKTVTLIEGAVGVNLPGQQNALNMKADQHLTYNAANHQMQLYEGDTYKYYAWKDNKLVFRNDPMSYVVKRIGQLYGVQIELQGDKLQDYRYRATFEEESLYEILNLLKLSAPIDYRKEARRQNDDSSFSKPKIIIYPVTQRTRDN